MLLILIELFCFFVYSPTYVETVERGFLIIFYSVFLAFCDTVTYIAGEQFALRANALTR